MKRTISVAVLVMAVACSRETTTQSTTTSSSSTSTEVASGSGDSAATPMGSEDDRKAQEKERFDEQWRQLQSFNAQQAAQQAAANAATATDSATTATAANTTAATNPAASEQLHFIQSAKKEHFTGMDSNAINNAPLSVPVTGDVSGPTVLKAQVMLDRAHFSVGALDGRWGRNSAIATWWFQRSHNLPSTGSMDEATFRALAGVAGAGPTLVSYQVTADDLKGPFTKLPSDVYEKAKLDCLCYETLKEELAEKFHTTQDFLDVLNPGTSFTDMQVAAAINVPNVRQPMTADQPDVARVVVSVAGNTLTGFDASNNVLFHAPTTLGSKYDPSPDETVKIVSITEHPNFHYQPTLFHEVPDSDPEAELKPGPNSPVGEVWMALSKPHFGIHGTSDPESIGYASSHGCVRLTNWDALELSHRVSKGVTVSFVDTRKGGTV